MTKIIKTKTTDIQPYAGNPRKNQPVEKVAKSIEKFGFNSPIIVDKNNVIIAGHTRWKAAKHLNMEEVPVVKVDLPEKLANEYRIVDNKLSEEATWDKFLLEMAVDELPMEEWDFEFSEDSDVVEAIKEDVLDVGHEATDQQKKLIFLYSNPSKYRKHFDKIQNIKYEYGFDTDDQIIDYLLEKVK